VLAIVADVNDTVGAVESATDQVAYNVTSAAI
jgi:hypothetical protein